MERLELSVTRLDPVANGDIPLPRAMSDGAAGMDIHAAVDGELIIEPGRTAAVPTGFAIAVPCGYEAQVRPRSGLALRHGIIIPNSPGTIDSDYRGEVKVILGNMSDRPVVIRRGDRIAQLVVCPVAAVEWKEVEQLPATTRGEGGFGHTGR